MQYLQKTTSDINTFPTAPSVVGEFISSSSRITKYCPYTSGLVFWLDGIDKGPNSGNWTDLIGGHVFSVPSGSTTPTSIDNGWAFDSSSNSGANGTQVFKCTDTLNMKMTNNYTIEITFKCNKANTWCIFNQPAANDICFGVSANGIKYIIQNGNPSVNYLRTNAAEGIITISLNLTRCYANGTNVSSNTTGKFSLTGGGVLIGAYKIGSGNWPFYGDIYSIRIYNRALSAAEMVYNQRIDNKRFNLGLEI